MPTDHEIIASHSVEARNKIINGLITFLQRYYAEELPKDLVPATKPQIDELIVLLTAQLNKVSCEIETLENIKIKLKTLIGIDYFSYPQLMASLDILASPKSLLAFQEVISQVISYSLGKIGVLSSIFYTVFLPIRDDLRAHAEILIKAIPYLSVSKRTDKELKTDDLKMKDLVISLAQINQCPITCVEMTTPIIMPDGYTYDPTAVDGCLEGAGKDASEKFKSPFTRALIPNQRIQNELIIELGKILPKSQEDIAKYIIDSLIAKIPELFNDLRKYVSSITRHYEWAANIVREIIRIAEAEDLPAYPAFSKDLISQYSFQKIINKIPLLAAFYCPISHQTLIDPVIMPDGYTYDKNTIVAMLNASTKRIDGKPIFKSPKTERSYGISISDLITNLAIKALTENFQTSKLHIVISILFTMEYENNFLASHLLALSNHQKQIAARHLDLLTRRSLAYDSTRPTVESSPLPPIVMPMPLDVHKSLVARGHSIPPAPDTSTTEIVTSLPPRTIQARRSTLIFGLEIPRALAAIFGLGS